MTILCPPSLHRTDSRQIAALRARFKLDRGDEHATPYRLGRYARQQSIPIDDMGAHSKRWVKQFQAGYALDKPRRKRVKQLPLFFPDKRGQPLT